MATCKFKYNGMDFEFSDKDVCQEPVDFEFSGVGHYGPETGYYYMHDHGFCVAVIFADNFQEALDIAADHDKLSGFLIEEKDYPDYDVMGENPTCAFLGNAGEPFDIDNLEVIELALPKFSLAAIFQAYFDEKEGSKK